MAAMPLFSQVIVQPTLHTSEAYLAGCQHTSLCISDEFNDLGGPTKASTVRQDLHLQCPFCSTKQTGRPASSLHVPPEQSTWLHALYRGLLCSLEEGYLFLLAAIATEIRLSNQPESTPPVSWLQQIHCGHVRMVTPSGLCSQLHQLQCGHKRVLRTQRFPLLPTSAPAQTQHGPPLTRPPQLHHGSVRVVDSPIRTLSYDSFSTECEGRGTISLHLQLRKPSSYDGSSADV